MFRKRKVQLSESSSLIRKTDNEVQDSQDEDDKEEASLIKRQKPTESSLPAKDEENENAEQATDDQILDGEMIEELIEAAKKRNTALVDVDEAQKPKKTSKFGPTSAPAYMRATTIIDYKPDLCKDYNETGYCGYGDSCIYLHDRTTYVSGNVLDQRWDEMLKKKNSAPVVQPSSSFGAKTCGICEAPLRAPIVKTRCGHQFCRTCALERFDKTPTCATCGMQTMGIFNEVKQEAK